MKRLLAPALLASSLFATTFAVNLQTPLYGVYAANSGVGATAITIAFAAYVAGLMPTLLLLGGLSDRIGRRVPVALALLLGVAATALLALRPGWTSLVVARALLGIGTGLATTAGTAYMTDLLGAGQTRLATLIVTSATSLGFGGGALATSASLAVQGPTVAPASFLALIAIAPLLALAVLGLPRADTPQGVSLLRFPVFPANTWVFGMALALAWATTGMTIAVVPLALHAQGRGGWTGMVVFLAIFIGFLCQPLARRMGNAAALAWGFVLVPLGFVVLIAGAWSHAIVLVLAGTGMTSAVSYGFTYLAALTEFAMRAPANRARATAGLFVYAYAGFSLPVIASGVLADRFGVLPAMGIFSAFQVGVTVLTVVLWRRHAALPLARPI